MDHWPLTVLEHLPAGTSFGRVDDEADVNVVAHPKFDRGGVDAGLLARIAASSRPRYPERTAQFRPITFSPIAKG